MINFKNIFFVVLCVVFLFSCSTTKTIDTYNDFVLKEVKKKYAPDLRVTIFDVKGLKKGKNIFLKGETNIPEAKNQVIEEFSKLKMNISDSIKLLPGLELKEKFAVVRLSVANLRTRPEHSAEMATQAIMGTPLKLLRNENGWSQVQTPDNYIAWVDNSGIESMNEAEKSKWLKMPKVIAVVQQGFINESNELNSRPVSDFVIGNILGLKGESLDKNLWVVALPDNRIGYANKNAFRKLDEFFEEKSDITGDDIINSSFQFMGAPYLWGGTSSKGMDCSGFTKTVFFINGYIIPRDASQQVLVGEKVAIDESFSKLLPGDLLFFGNKRTDNSERITHVALYTGDERFIHSSGNVKIESLLRSEPDFNDFRASSLLQVRRYIVGKDLPGIIKIRKTEGY